MKSKKRIKSKKTKSSDWLSNVGEAGDRLVILMIATEAARLMATNPVANRARIWDLIQRLKKKMDDSKMTEKEQGEILKPLAEIAVATTMLALMSDSKMLK